MAKMIPVKTPRDARMMNEVRATERPPCRRKIALNNRVRYVAIFGFRQPLRTCPRPVDRSHGLIAGRKPARGRAFSSVRRSGLNFVHPAATLWTGAENHLRPNARSSR